MSDVITAAFGLGGVVVGGMLAIAGTWFLDKQRDARTAERLARSFSAEATAMIEVFDRGKYVERLEALAVAARGGNIQLPRIRITQEFLPVINANLAQIGLLPGDLPKSLAIFLAMLKVVAEDFGGMERGGWDDRTDQQLGQGLEETVDHLKRAIAAGRKFIYGVSSEYDGA